MAIIDRKRKIAIIKVDTEYAWNIERGLPSGYIPHLYYFEDQYGIDWIGEEGDTIQYISSITPEQAIRNAFKWCLTKGLITNPIYIK